MVLFIFLRKKDIVRPFHPQFTIWEAGFISGTTSLFFVLAGPTLASYLGSKLAVYRSSSYFVGLNALSGLSGGTVAGATGVTLSTFIVKRKYKAWLKENGGKYFYNNFGRLEQIPLSFIPASSTLLPYWLMLILPSIYVFFISFMKTKHLIQLRKQV